MRTQQLMLKGVGEKEVEEEVIILEEEIFARWRSSTVTIMSMVSDKEFL